MKRKLLKLADTLDELGLGKDADIVDYYISKSSQQDEFDKFASDVVLDELAMKGDVSISLPEGSTVINVFSDPLGEMIRVYAEKMAQLFHNDPSQRNGQITVKEADDIVDSFKQLNNNLTASKVHWSENDSLIYPQTVSQIVKSIGSFVYHNSSFEIDARLYIDSLEDIELTYNDFYMEDYLRQEYDPREYSREVDEWRSNPENYEKEKDQGARSQQYAERQSQMAEQKKREQELKRLREVDPKVFEEEDTENIG